MVSDAEKAAEEHNTWCLNQTLDPTCGRYGVSNYNSFLAGVAWAQGTWTKCSDAMPEEYGEYWGSFRGGEVGTLRFEQRGWGTTDSDGTYCSYSDQSVVIAWMPIRIPEPFKEEQSK